VEKTTTFGQQIGIEILLNERFSIIFSNALKQKNVLVVTD
jgi:hypothetical protein